jgi:hypothetical protein
MGDVMSILKHAKAIYAKVGDILCVFLFTPIPDNFTHQRSVECIF